MQSEYFQETAINFLSLTNARKTHTAEAKLKTVLFQISYLLPVFCCDAKALEYTRR